MKIISHRGNLIGSESEWENHPSRINTAINEGYDVEIDVWKIGLELFLGHDDPKFPIDRKFLQNEKLLCHAKNLEALEFMLKLDDVHCFWHQEDHYTITSQGYIVSYPGYAVTPRTICRKPELQSYDCLHDSCYAICTDYPTKYDLGK